MSAAAGQQTPATGSSSSCRGGLLGALGLLLSVVPPISFVVAFAVARSGGAASFPIWGMLSLGATAAAIVVLAMLRRRGFAGWFAGVLTTVLVFGVLGYAAWGFVLWLDAALRASTSV